MQLTLNNLNRQIYRLVAPGFLDNLAQAIGAMLAISVVSRCLGTSAVAATGVATVFIMALQGIALGLGVGATSLVAQSVGAGDLRRASRYAGQAIITALLCAIVVTAISHTWARPMLAFLGATGETYDLTLPFFTLAVSVLPFTFVLFICLGVIRGYGDTLRPMVIMVTNTTLYYILCRATVSPHESARAGMIHVGWAYIAATIVTTLMALIALYGQRRRFRASLRDVFAVDLPRLREIVTVSAPAFGEQLVMRTGFFVFNMFLVRLGTGAFAANQLAGRIEALSFMPGFAFGIATTTLVGQAVGGGDIALARTATLRSARAACITMGAIALIFLFAAGWLTALFRPEPSVARVTIACVRIAALEQIPLALFFSYAGCLRGSGDTLSPMLVRLLGTIFIRVIGVYIIIVKLGLGLPYVWAAMVIEWWLAAIIALIVYRRGRWTRAAIVTKAAIVTTEEDAASGPFAVID